MFPDVFSTSRFTSTNLESSIASRTLVYAGRFVTGITIITQVAVINAVHLMGMRELHNFIPPYTAQTIKNHLDNVNFHNRFYYKVHLYHQFKYTYSFQFAVFSISQVECSQSIPSGSLCKLGLKSAV
jgi:hypothetical protein